MNRLWLWAAIIFLGLGTGCDRVSTESNGGTGILRIHADQQGAPISDILYGAFFEDINHGADGGLHAEMVQNRSFEFSRADGANLHALTAWSLVQRDGARASMGVDDQEPLNERNKHYLVLELSAGQGWAGVSNSGYNQGFYVEAGKGYLFSFYARRSADFHKPFRIVVESAGGTVYAETTLVVDSPEWKLYTARLTASGTTVNGRLVVLTSGTDTVCLDMISLYPEDTFKGLPIRADIAQMIADLKPGFFRFPGGCIVHAGSYRPDSLYRVYRWKDTVGDPAQRPESAGMWAGNHQSFGLGFYEHFLFAEAIGATPVPHVTAGIDPHEVPGERGGWYYVPLNQMQEWIDNALDLIEFANGDVTTKWGALRAELGHPEPFNLKYIGIGNEDINREYMERFVLFQKAIKEKYADIQVISSSGPFSQGREFDYGWQFSRQVGADVVDEHYYNDPNWFLDNWRRYDSYDRSGPKVFIGEYASKGNTFYNALAEAAFMTGIERNGDIIVMAAYAPLLANVDYLNWTPDLIWFNNHQVYGTPNYYVQQMFSHHKGDVLVPCTFSGTPGRQAEPAPIRGGIGLATWSTQVKFSDVMVIDNATGAVLFHDDFADLSQWQARSGIWRIADGGYVQGAGGNDLRSYAGDANWSNYTLTLKATKLSGAEGFLIMFGRRDDYNYYWWNIGGWNNTQHAVEKAVNGSRGPVVSQAAAPVQIGREYDIKIVVEGRRIRCYLDGRLIHDYYDGPKQVEPLYYVTSKDLETGELIIKAVNALGSPMETQVEIEGAAEVHPEGTVITLAADSLDAVNSFQNPTRVAPAARKITGLGREFTYIFPPYSVTIMRLRAE